MLEHTAHKPHFNRMLLLLIAGLIAAGRPGMGQSGAMLSRAADNATKSPARSEERRVGKECLE